MSFLQVYQRICDTLDVHTQIGLATALGIRQAEVSDARRRQIVPAGWLLTLLAQGGINPHWLLTGTGAKYLVPDLERV